MSKAIFDEIKSLVTETRNLRTMDIDAKGTEEILRQINLEDQNIPQIVAQEIPHITQATEIIVESFQNHGKLFYVGAGTSGRLGVLDASECPPTFGTDPQMIQGLIAGGYKALVWSQEGAEDSEASGREDLVHAGVSSKDVVFGIAATRAKNSWR